MPVYFLSVWVHIMAAVVWIGGAFFLAFVLIPALRGPGLQVRPIDIIRATAGRLLWVGWGALILLTATGILNLHYRGVTWETFLQDAFRRQPFGQLVAWKVGLMSVVVVLSLVHDFFLGPHVARSFQDTPSSPSTGLRILARWIGRVNLLLGLLMVGLGVALVRGWPW